MGTQLLKVSTKTSRKASQDGKPVHKHDQHTHTTTHTPDDPYNTGLGTQIALHYLVPIYILHYFRVERSTYKIVEL